MTETLGAIVCGEHGHRWPCPSCVTKDTGTIRMNGIVRESPAVKSAREYLAFVAREGLDGADQNHGTRIQFRTTPVYTEKPAPLWAKILLAALIATGLAFFALGMLFF